jgi:hypothetical protein
MTTGRLDLAAVARQQNDTDFAAGRMPSRYVEDVAVLTKVVTLAFAGTGPPTSDSAPGSGKPSAVRTVPGRAAPERVVLMLPLPDNIAVRRSTP